MTLQTTDVAGYGDLINRYGFPVIFVILLSLFFYKGLWPFLKAQIETTQQTLREQMERAHTARETALNQFMTALERRDEQFGKIVESVDSLVIAVNDLKNQRKGQS